MTDEQLCWVCGVPAPEPDTWVTFLVDGERFEHALCGECTASFDEWGDAHGGFHTLEDRRERARVRRRERAEEAAARS